MRVHPCGAVVLAGVIERVEVVSQRVGVAQDDQDILGGQARVVGAHGVTAARLASMFSVCRRSWSR